MRVFVKWLDVGNDAGVVDIGLANSVATVHGEVAELTGVHASLQQLVFGGVKLEDKDKTVGEYGIGIDDVLRLRALPEPRAIKLNVGGVPYQTSLATLRKVKGSHLAAMFDGREHEHGAGAGAALPEGVPRGQSTVLLPRAADGPPAVIDRNGTLFQYVLDYLREYDAAAGNAAAAAACDYNAELQAEPEPEEGAEEAPVHTPTSISLPQTYAEVRLLAIEARFYGLNELAEAAGNLAPLPTLAAACGAGFTAKDVAALSDVQITELMQQQGINVLQAQQIRTAVATEHVRIKAEAEAEAARLAAQAEVERAREALRAELRRCEVELSEAGLRTLVGAGRTHTRSLVELDEAAAARLGLNAEDARLVGALARAGGISAQALTFTHCNGGMQGQGTGRCATSQQGQAAAVGGEALDPSAGPVFWKATIGPIGPIDRNGWVFLGVIGNAQPQANGYGDPTAFGWISHDGGSYATIAGQHTKGHGGWPKAGFNKAGGDVVIFKLEAHQLSMRHQRLGRTFTIPTNGAGGLRVHANLNCHPSSVALSPAEPHEEY
eukprot:COSAG02_NODE_3562_length_6554_cov_8.462277_5_plen_551_part_00